MDDIPNIPPVKPLWPKRPDEDSRKRHQNDDDINKEKKKETDDNQPGPHDPDYDGQIDEYV